MTPETLFKITGETELDGVTFDPGSMPEDFWKKWKEQFNNLDAAGGLIVRDDRSFLGIYRLEKWDLPKGKAEHGETPEITAIREVEEECGVREVRIVHPLPDTYHVYPHRGQFVLKKTHWFLMHWSGDGNLVPQTEEGIESLRWFSPDDIDEFCAASYQSVAEVVRAGYGGV